MREAWPGASSGEAGGLKERSSTTAPRSRRTQVKECSVSIRHHPSSPAGSGNAASGTTCAGVSFSSEMYGASRSLSAAKTSSFPAVRSWRKHTDNLSSGNGLWLSTVRCAKERTSSEERSAGQGTLSPKKRRPGSTRTGGSGFGGSWTPAFIGLGMSAGFAGGRGLSKKILIFFGRVVRVGRIIGLGRLVG